MKFGALLKEAKEEDLSNHIFYLLLFARRFILALCITFLNIGFLQLIIGSVMTLSVIYI